MKILKSIGVVVAVFVAIGVLGFLYLYFRHPAMAPASQVKVDMSPDRIERGRYIFMNLGGCDDCHSQRDFTKLGGPVVPTGRGRGNVMPLNDLPGRLVAYNLTPDKETGLGTWTDGEKIRAIREGIDKDGNMLFPLMPYSNYRHMSDYDVESVVAYLDSIAPVRNRLPKTSIDFPVSMMVKGVPRPVNGKVAQVTPADGDRYGEYLATIAGCEECHTPMVRGQADASMRFAGGRVFATQYGTVLSANITPDNETGIGQWDYPRFRLRIENYHFENPPPVGPERFTLMPWIAYSGATEQDLKAIFGYIKGRPPITHKVVPHPGYPQANTN